MEVDTNLEEDEALRVGRCRRSNRVERVNSDMTVADNLTAGRVDLLWRREVVFLGVDEVSGFKATVS